MAWMSWPTLVIIYWLVFRPVIVCIVESAKCSYSVRRCWRAHTGKGCRGVESIEQTLKEYFGYDAFLPGQREVVEQVISGRDAFVLMPTGAGKSLTYQFSGLLLPGLTVIVSPLIALMQDQVDRLSANGIAATFINSSLSNQERVRREQEILDQQL